MVDCELAEETLGQSIEALLRVYRVQGFTFLAVSDMSDAGRRSG